MKIHRLVANSFLGPRPAGLDTLHIDGDKTNNAVTNLRYGTRSENELDKVRHGTHHHSAKTHCKSGHEFTPENTRIAYRPDGTFKQVLSSMRGDQAPAPGPQGGQP